MHKWTMLAFMMLGCTTQSGEASKPDGGDMSTFDEFTRWGMGMAGFTAPPSNQVAGGGGSGGSDADGGGAEDEGGESANNSAHCELADTGWWGSDTGVWGSDTGWWGEGDTGWGEGK